MLNVSDFQPEHLIDLRNSGLSDETIEQAGLYSVRPGDIKHVTSHTKVESMLAIPYTQEFTRYKVFPTNLKAKTGFFAQPPKRCISGMTRSEPTQERAV